MVPEFAIVNMRLNIHPPQLKWGGLIVAFFVLKCAPFIISRAHLIRCPDGTFAISLTHNNAGGRFAIVDPDFRAAVIEAASAAYEQAAAPLRLHLAVPPVATAPTIAGTEHDPPSTPGPA